MTPFRFVAIKHDRRDGNNDACINALTQQSLDKQNTCPPQDDVLNLANDGEKEKLKTEN